MKRIVAVLGLTFISLLAYSQNFKTLSALVTFKTKMFGISIDGSLKNFSGSIKFDPNNLAGSSISGSVDASTIDTYNTLRNNHLKEKEEFFNIAKYPKLSMKSTKIEKTDTGFLGTFDLTMKETTKTIKMPFTVSAEGDKLVFKGSFVLNRRDWKVGGGTLGLSNDVTVSITLNTLSQ